MMTPEERINILEDKLEQVMTLLKYMVHASRGFDNKTTDWLLSEISDIEQIGN